MFTFDCICGFNIAFPFLKVVPAPFYTLWHIIGINMATCSW